MWYSLHLDLAENYFFGNRLDKGALWIGLAILAFTIYVLVRDKKRKNLPPGPVGLPIFGYYFFLKKDPVKKLANLAKRYGGVLGLHIGPKYIVFLSEWKAIKEGLGHKSTANRPPTLFHKVPYKFGFAGINGAEWSELRRFSVKIMKDGLQQNNWEDLIEEEVSTAIDAIRQEGGNPIDVRLFFRDSFANNIMSLIFGHRMETGNYFTKMMARTVDYIMQYLPTLKLDTFSGTLSTILSKLGLETIPLFAENTQELFAYVEKLVDSNIRDSKSGLKDSFLSRFQEEIDARKGQQGTYITDETLKGTILLLMTGGSETTRTSTLWALIAMAENQDKQRKVHEELDRVIGKEGSLRWSDRSKVPYTLATLLEALRWRSTIPLNTMRMTDSDIQIQGYDIPKGTFIITNNWCAHNDPNYWENPDKFMPERFLLNDGGKVNMTPDSYLPFSYGKRGCAGKLLALMNMLMYFGTLMQKFQVVPKEGEKVEFEEILGLSYQARNAELRFIPR